MTRTRGTLFIALFLGTSAFINGGCATTRPTSTASTDKAIVLLVSKTTNLLEMVKDTRKQARLPEADMKRWEALSEEVGTLYVESGTWYDTRDYLVEMKWKRAPHPIARDRSITIDELFNEFEARRAEYSNHFEELRSEYVALVISATKQQ
jgi:hypothetical protein